MISRFVLQVDYNEMDVLPSAYSVYNTGWLAHDRYLSLSIPYRELFGYIIGYFIDIAGFIPVLILGRILTYSLFAIAYYKLLEAAKVHFLIGALSLIAYLFWFGDGAFYGEWMVGGLETKAFSYVFLIFSLSSFLKKQVRACLFFAGLALSFHIMVGGYFMICLLLVLLISHLKREPLLSDFIKNSFYFFLGGAWGLFGVYSHLNVGSETNYGWEIYTQIRVPYHVFPKFSPWSLIVPFVFFLFNFLNFKLSKSDALRTLSAFGIAAYTISLIGFLVYFLGETSLLRFYLFRFNDAIQPFLVIIILGSILSGYIGFSKNIIYRVIAPVLTFSFVGFCFANSNNLIGQMSPSNYSEKAMLNKSSVDLIMSEWIKENTDPESVFIVPPDMSNFYMEANRSMFVSWKHSPQSANEIEEWYRRITLLNRGKDAMVENLFGQEDLARNYSELNQLEILNIKNEYPKLSYIILPRISSVEFPLVYETEKLKLYSLR